MTTDDSTHSVDDDYQQCIKEHAQWQSTHPVTPTRDGPQIRTHAPHPRQTTTPTTVTRTVHFFILQLALYPAMYLHKPGCSGGAPWPGTTHSILQVAAVGLPGPVQLPPIPGCSGGAPWPGTTHSIFQVAAVGLPGPEQRTVYSRLQRWGYLVQRRATLPLHSPRAFQVAAVGLPGQRNAIIHCSDPTCSRLQQWGSLLQNGTLALAWHIPGGCRCGSLYTFFYKHVTRPPPTAGQSPGLNQMRKTCTGTGRPV